MNFGKYVFTQIADLIKLTPVRKLVKKYRGDYRAHDLTCYNQFLHLLFGQLSSCTSLRDICLCLKAHESSLFHMGFGNTVDHTTLSRANERRDCRIYEELGCFLFSNFYFSRFINNINLHFNARFNTVCQADHLTQKGPTRKAGQSFCFQAMCRRLTAPQSSW